MYVINTFVIYSVMQCKFGQIMNLISQLNIDISNTEVLNLVVFSVYMYVKERKHLNYDKFHFQIHYMLYNFINAFCIYRYTDIVTTPPRLQMTR